VYGVSWVIALLQKRDIKLLSKKRLTINE